MILYFSNMESLDRIKVWNSLSEKSLMYLSGSLKKVSFSKKEIIVSEGQRNRYTYFVIKGAVRAYVLRDGKYRIAFFAFDGDMATFVPGTTQIISKLTLEALEDTTLYRISNSDIEKLFNESIELANWGRALLEKHLIECEHYFTDYFRGDKSAQYIALIKEYPELLQRVTLKDLADYIDLTPQSLSRIRSKIK